MAETAQEKVARIRAELAAKRAGGAPPPAAAPAAPPPAAPAAPAAPPPAAPAASAYAHIPGMTEAVWSVLSADTKSAVLAQNPAPVVAPPPAAPAAVCVPQVTLYEQQTAPINPPDMLQGTEPPVPGAVAAPVEAPKKGRGKAAVVTAAAPASETPASDATQERIATALETIAALLEIVASGQQLS